MFIGWHGNVRKNINTLQEQVTALPPNTNKPWYDDGFFCFDNLKVARREALIKRRRCQFELKNNDNDDSCDEAMCGIFADRKWWLDRVGKAFFSPESLLEHGSKQGVLKFLDGYIKGEEKLQDKPIAAFRYYYASEQSMSLSIPEEYTSGLIAVCAPDEIDQDDFESGLNANPRFKNGVDTVQEFFGKYYESMDNLRYHSEVVEGTDWNAYQF
ncbi:hypothetical protein BKA69DRAFT_1106547 [Paraphysoderma sedebokerense]|nr:hypothetical protein BKA69DRAFT_1106547 [Paraphysoderma sedebokerense]